MNIIEAIKERRSVRSFDGESLPADVKKELLDFAAKTVNPFGGRYSVKLKEFDLRGGFKPSTYGMIKGAQDFFMLGIADDDTSALAAGFGFEQVVLKAWQLGYGTCWIAATFKGTDFDNGTAWTDGESLKIVCPVGRPVKKSLMEKFTRMTLGSKNRKNFDELFFDSDFERPLSPESRYGEALAMLRLAPSSTNSQPWRALVEGEKVHFYCVPKSQCSVLDCGIGLCHFYETERFNGFVGEFYNDPEAPAPKSNWRYLTSYKRTK